MVEEFPLDKANDAFGRSPGMDYTNSTLIVDIFTDAMMKGTVRFRAVLTMN